MESEQKFASFLDTLQERAVFPECLRANGKKYELNTQELLKISPAEVARLRRVLISKSESEEEFKERMKTEWNECEKKVFNWLAIAYAHLHSKTLLQLDDHDLLFLADISSHKPLPLIKYQLCTLLKQESRPKWSQQEDTILYQILAVECKFKTVGEWIFVSKELFLRGDHKAFKSAKHCRERWFNHLDPALSKEWSREEDLALLQSVNKEGKRWALISTILHHSKNEHMIKNRFYSLIKKAQKGRSSALDEEQIVDFLITRLSKEPQLPPKEEKEEKKVSEGDVPMQQSKEETLEMRLLASMQLFPARESHLLEQSLQFKGFEEKLFKEEGQDNEAKRDPLKLSQSIAYNVSYPSPVPVTPGSDLNLFGQSGAGRGFRFNYQDYVMKQ